MSLLNGLPLWVLLAVAIGVAVVVAAGVGSVYGRLARRLNDETAARGTNIIAIGAALCAGIPVWALVDAGTSVDTGIVPPGVLAGLLASVIGGLAAGGVGTAAIAGIVRARPGLPGVSDPATVRRHYARYLTSLFVVILALISAAEPALRTGPLAIGVVLTGLVLVLWICAPFIATLTANTRHPTDTEAAHIDELLEASGLSVRGVRVIEADEQYVTVELSGAPGGRFLFVSRGALETFSAETLTALLTARREQAVHYETTVGIVALVAPLVLLVAILDGALSVPFGLPATVGIALVGLVVARRLRYYTDARAAERVGREALADAFERACEAAGLELEDAGGRRWLSTTPSIATRIERLRDAPDGANGAAN